MGVEIMSVLGFCMFGIMFKPPSPFTRGRGDLYLNAVLRDRDILKEALRLACERLMLLEEAPPDCHGCDGLGCGDTGLQKCWHRHLTEQAKKSGISAVNSTKD